MKRIISLLIVLSLTAGAFGIFGVVTENVSAGPYFSGVERTWDAIGDSTANVAANWDPVGTPTTGDNITFDGTSTFDCDWNVETTLGNFSMLTGYTGEVTQSADYGCVDFYVEAGTFTGQLAPQLWLNCEGNFTVSSPGTLSANELHLNMTGSDTTVTMNTPNAFETLRISNDVSINYPSGLLRTNHLDIGEYTVTVTDTTTFVWKAFLDYTYSNLGTITGDGLFGIFLLNSDHIIDIGNVQCSAKIILQGGAINPYSLTCTDPGIFGDTLLIESEVASAFTVDFEDNTLTVDGTFTLGNRVILTQGTGTWSFGEYNQSGADSVFTQGGDFKTNNYTISDGIFNSGPTIYPLTCTNNWTKASPGTVNSVWLNMTGDNGYLSSDTPQGFFSVHFWGNTTVTQTVWGSGLTIGPTTTTTVESGKKLIYVAVDNYLNLGTITGDGAFEIDFYNNDEVIVFGTILIDVLLLTSSAASDNRILYLGENTLITGDLELYSSHATYTFELNHGDNYTLTVTGLVEAKAKLIANQGTGTWTFESYVQNGVDSIFNQGGPVSCGDFTISNGEFISSNDSITVSGDWSTTGFVNANGAVYLTGDEKTLNMVATDSFYNVTIDAGANYTLDDDVYVDCRATIIGIQYGAGDFIEPKPEFTSTAVLHACPGELYEYDVTQTYWDTLSIHSGPYWLYLDDGDIIGVPNENDTGIHFISLKLSWNDMETYQNYTLVVCGEALSEVDIFYIFFAFQLILFVIGLIGYFRLPFLLIFTVLATFAIAIPTIIYFGDLFVIAFILIMMNMMVGTMGLLKVRRKRDV